MNRYRMPGMLRRPVLLIALIAGATAPRAGAQKFLGLGVRDAEVLGYFQRLQQAIRVHDRATVAGMVNYPLRVNHGPASHVMIAGKADLLRQFDAVFSPAIRQGILDQPAEALIGTAPGVAVERGAVWLTGRCDHKRPPVCHVGISSINLPAQSVHP